MRGGLGERQEDFSGGLEREGEVGVILGCVSETSVAEEGGA
jgi:hypothetical protein